MVQKIAIKELGTDVFFAPYLYVCRLPEQYVLPKRCDETVMKRFERVTDDVLCVHGRIYDDILTEWFDNTLKVQIFHSRRRKVKKEQRK